MARFAQRPDNALKRANEFMEIGKPANALDTLQEVFRNKKWAYNWSETVLEPIMFRYLELCVELRKSHIAKEGLFQYRNIFQSLNVCSLENVIRGYLKMAEDRTEAAREQSAQAVVDIDDLDNLATPESILLSAVSGEDAQDRSDRTILTPWVKFLWESYCQCLELLRTNAHVENLYHDIARMAFQFCLKYTRKTEFRKLCDKLRKHLEDICKLTIQTGNVSITRPETQQFNLETRLFQLESAIQMELWQEAYKAIEDIHNLMNMSKKTPVAKTMANYYGKLALVFWKAGHCLFHAAALLKLFQLSREMKKNITPEELQRMACRVLIATLSIPLPSLHPEFDRFIETDKSPMEKAQRLAVLLGLPQPPTRVSLLKEIVRLNVVNLASPELQNMYNWLEVEFDPLNVAKKVGGVIDALEADETSPLNQYVGALRDVTLIRLVRQVAQCYQSIKFSRLLELAIFTDSFHLERLLVDCVRHNDMQIRIDHANKCIHFGVELSEAARESVPEGPFLQEMPSEQVRGQLIRMATVLTKAAAIVDPKRCRTERDRLRALAVQHYHENKVKEHQRVLQRHKIIEDRKEYIERLNIVREEEEARRQEELARQQMIAEQKRLDLEREEREKRRQQSEIQLIRDRHLKEKMQQISQTAHGKKVLKKLDDEDINKIDADTIAMKEAEELLKERKELQARLKSQDKRVDYFERAKRLEEIPLLQKSLEEKRIQDKAFWEQQEEERIKQLKEARELDLATAARLKRMTTHCEEFLKRLQSEREAEHVNKVEKFEELLKSERELRLASRAEERKEQRKKDWYTEKELAEERKAEEERRAREEEERKIREEEERVKAEKERAIREKQEQEKKAHMEMLERAAAKAREREEEIERKLREQQQSTGGDSKWRKDRERGGDRDRGERDVERPRERDVERPRERDVDRPRERDIDRPRDRDVERPRERGDRDEGSSWRSLRAARDEPTSEKKTEPWRAGRARGGDDKDRDDKPGDTSSWRKERDERDDREPPHRRDDRERNILKRDDKDTPRRDRDDRDRDAPRKDDRDRHWNRDDRDKRDDRYGDKDRYPRRDDRGDRGDRESTASSWRSKDSGPAPDRSERGERSERGGGGSSTWRSAGAARDRDTPKSKDSRDRDDGHRDKERDSHKDTPRRPPPPKEKDDDDWTPVKRR